MPLDPGGFLTQLVTYFAYSTALGRDAVGGELDFLRERSGLSAEDFDTLVRETRTRCEQTRDDMARRLASAVRGGMAPLAQFLDLASRAELEALRREVADLRSRVAPQDAAAAAGPDAPGEP